MRFISVLPLILLAGCATSTQHAGQTAPSKAPAAVVSAGSSATNAQFATIDESNLARAQAMGYKVVNENGKKLYCRRSLVTGTRLHYQTDCATEEELLRTDAANHEAMERRSYNNPPPGG